MNRGPRRSVVIAILAATALAVGAGMWAGAAVAAVQTPDQVALPGGADPLPPKPDPVPSTPRPSNPAPRNPAPSNPAPAEPSTPAVAEPTEPVLSDAERAALAKEEAAKAAAAKAAAARAARAEKARKARAARIARQRRLAELARQRREAIEKVHAQVAEIDAGATKAVSTGVAEVGVVVTNAAGGLGDGGSGAVNNTVLVLLVILAIGSAVLAKLPDLSVASHMSLRAEGVIHIGRTRRPELIALSVGSLLLALLLIGLS